MIKEYLKLNLIKFKSKKVLEKVKDIYTLNNFNNIIKVKKLLSLKLYLILLIKLIIIVDIHFHFLFFSFQNLFLLISFIYN